MYCSCAQSKYRMQTNTTRSCNAKSVFSVVCSFYAVYALLCEIICIFDKIYSCNDASILPSKAPKETIYCHEYGCRQEVFTATFYYCVVDFYRKWGILKPDWFPTSRILCFSPDVMQLQKIKVHMPYMWLTKFKLLKNLKC